MHCLGDHFSIRNIKCLLDNNNNSRSFKNNKSMLTATTATIRKTIGAPLPQQQQQQ